MAKPCSAWTALLEPVLHLAALAVDGLVEKAGRAECGMDIGDDEARVGPTVRELRLPDNATLGRPALAFPISKVGEHSRRPAGPLRFALRLASFISGAIWTASRSLPASPSTYCTPLSSHQLIRSSRQKPLSARITIVVLGHCWRIWPTMRATSSQAPSAASFAEDRSFAASKCRPQKMYSGR